MAELTEVDLYNIYNRSSHSTEYEASVLGLKLMMASHLHLEHELSITASAKRVGIKRTLLKTYLETIKP